MDDNQIIMNEESTAQTAGTDTASAIVSVENLIKTHLAQIDRLKEELKKQKEMVDSVLENDPIYKEHADAAKIANLQKSKTKQNIFNKPDIAHLVDKVREMSGEIKETNEGLSGYLAQYQMLTGSNQFEADGEVRDIVYTAKLVKRSK